MSGREKEAFLGAVLAGGKSQRYGADKSGARIGGVPMVQRVLAAARAVCPEVVVVSSAPVAGAETTPRILDREPGCGPLSGLHAALHAAEDRGRAGVLLLACDLPLLEPELLELLLERAHHDPETPAWALRRKGATPGSWGGPPEVTCAVYRSGILPEVERRLDGADTSLQSLFRSVEGASLPVAGSPGSLVNVNTPEDRRRAEELAGSQQNDGGAGSP